MRTLEIVRNAPWAITPEMLTVIHDVLKDRATRFNLASLRTEYAARNSTRRQGTGLRYGLRDGVGIIPVTGVLAKRMNLFMAISGGNSTEILAEDFKEALGDPQVKSILLDIDSPGGTVDGTKALADLIYQSRGSKPIVAFANGLMASAAYWIGSAADRIIAEETAEVGSIGVISIHTEYSKQDEALGIKSTVIRSGKYKAAGNSVEPLTKESQQYIQDQLDYLYGIFTTEVARNRGTDVQTVLKDMADGRIFIGQQAVDAGLVDSLGNFKTALSVAGDMVRGGSVVQKKSFKTFNTEGEKKVKMTQNLQTQQTEDEEDEKWLNTMLGFADKRSLGIVDGREEVSSNYEEIEIEGTEDSSESGDEGWVDKMLALAGDRKALGK